MAKEFLIGSPEETVFYYKEILQKWSTVLEQCSSDQFRLFIETKIKEAEFIIKKTIKIYPDSFI